MPTSSPAMVIIAAVWKPDGGTWMCCGCRCWNASAVNTTWWHSLPSWRSISVSGSMHHSARSLAVACHGVYANERTEWAATVGASVGLRTVNERINQLEAELTHVHREPLTDVPAVVQFDGIWVSF